MVGEAAFVGRADEQGLLGASLRAAQSGQAQIILIEGEPGVGKTALLRQCVPGAPDVTAIWASGDPAESGLAFGMIGQLLAGLPGPVRPNATEFPPGPGLDLCPGGQAGATLITGTISGGLTLYIKFDGFNENGSNANPPYEGLFTLEWSQQF